MSLGHREAGLLSAGDEQLCLPQSRSACSCGQHVVADSSMQIGGRCHTSAISIAILTTLTRLTSSSDISCTTLAASLLLPFSLVLSSFEYLLEAGP